MSDPIFPCPEGFPADPAARPTHLKPVRRAPARHLHPSPHKPNRYPPPTNACSRSRAQGEERQPVPDLRYELAGEERTAGSSASRGSGTVSPHEERDPPPHQPGRRAACMVTRRGSSCRSSRTIRRCRSRTPTGRREPGARRIRCAAGGSPRRVKNEPALPRVAGRQTAAVGVRRERAADSSRPSSTNGPPSPFAQKPRSSSVMSGM